MSKKKKKEMTTVIALAALLVVVCVAYFAAVKHKEAKEKAADTSVNLLQLDTSKATTIDISNENGTISFEKESTGWVMPSDKEFLVKQEEIQTILDAFSDLVATRCVVENKDSIAEYGLDKPTGKITITLSDGTTTVLSVGDTVPSEGGYYGMLDNADGVYTFDETSINGALASKDTFEDSAAEAAEEPAATTDASAE